jgi:hypothetical protein
MIRLALKTLGCLWAGAWLDGALMRPSLFIDHANYSSDVWMLAVEIAIPVWLLLCRKESYQALFNGEDLP